MSTTGFAKLIDLIIAFWDRLMPWTTIDSFERALVLRLGGGRQRSPGGQPYERVIGPTDGWFGTGLHLVWPFIEDVLSWNVVPTTSSYPNQVFTSKVGTPYLCQAHILWSVRDIVVFLLDVEDAQDVLVDAVAGIVRRQIHTLDDEEIHAERLESMLTSKANDRTKRFGVKVHQIYISELAPTSFRAGVMRVEHGALQP